MLQYDTSALSSRNALDATDLLPRRPRDAQDHRSYHPTDTSAINSTSIIRYEQRYQTSEGDRAVMRDAGVIFYYRNTLCVDVEATESGLL